MAWHAYKPTTERPETKLTRVSVNRARLHAGQPAIRVEAHVLKDDGTGGRRRLTVRHARAVRGRGWLLRTERYGRRWFVYLYTAEAVEVLP